MSSSRARSPGRVSYRLVSAFPRAGGRRSPQGAGRTSVVPPAASIARTAAGREAVRPHGERLGELAPAEHLDQAPLGHEAPGPQRLGGDLGAGVERLERVEVHDVVLDPERVVEALRLRRPAVQRRLATLEPGLARCRGRPGPCCPGRRSCRPCRRCRARPGAGPACEPGRRLQIMDLHWHLQTSSTAHEVRAPGRASRGSRDGRACSSVRADPPQPERRAACRAAWAWCRSPTAPA